MLEFHNTVMGRLFYEKQLPDLIKALNRVADELHAFNQSHESTSVSGKEDEDHA